MVGRDSKAVRFLSVLVVESVRHLVWRSETRREAVRTTVAVRSVVARALAVAVAGEEDRSFAVRL